MLEFIQNIIIFVLLAVVVLAVAIQAYSLWLGKAQVEIDLDSRSKFKLISFAENEAVFESEFFIANTGKRPDAMVLDAFSRHQLPEEQYDKAFLRTSLEREGYRRSDGYFEAFPFEGMKSERLIYTLAVRTKQPLVNIMEEIPDLKLEVYVSYVGKDAYRIKRWYFIASREELKQAIKAAGVVI